jgi:hypothetical protein
VKFVIVAVATVDEHSMAANLTFQAVSGGCPVDEVAVFSGLGEPGYRNTTQR